MAVTGEEHLPSELAQAFLARARPLNVRKRHFVVTEGSESADVYLVQSGSLRISLTTPSGREVSLRELGPGTIFGELAALDGAPRSASVSAIEDSLLARLSGEEFVRFLGEVPQAGLWMARQLSARVRDLTEKAAGLATLPVAGRVQRELLRLAELADMAGDRAVIHPMPTHAEIASRIGTHREAVTRELNLLAQEGVVTQRGRRAEIVSIALLRASFARIGRL